MIQQLQYGTNFVEVMECKTIQLWCRNISFTVMQDQHNRKSNPGTLQGLVTMPEDSDNTNTSSLMFNTRINPKATKEVTVGEEQEKTFILLTT